MQSKTFGRICTLIVAIACIFVFLKLGKDTTKSLPLPESIKKTTQTLSSTTEIFANQTDADPNPDFGKYSQSKQIEIGTPKGIIIADIAATDESRTQGLSGRVSMPKDSGLLFVFQNAGAFGFWMKDMNFPIDLIWIGADKRVRGVVPSVAPETYPDIFYPGEKISYVLELNSEGAQRFGIATGTQLVF